MQCFGFEGCGFRLRVQGSICLRFRFLGWELGFGALGSGFRAEGSSPLGSEACVGAVREKRVGETTGTGAWAYVDRGKDIRYLPLIFIDG